MRPSLSIPKGSCDRTINYTKRSHWQKVFSVGSASRWPLFLGINSRRVVSFHPEFRSHRAFRGKRRERGAEKQIRFNCNFSGHSCKILIRQSYPAIYQDLTLFVDSTSVLQTRLSRDVSLILRETGSSIFLEKYSAMRFIPLRNRQTEYVDFPGGAGKAKRLIQNKSFTRGLSSAFDCNKGSRTFM